MARTTGKQADAPEIVIAPSLRSGASSTGKVVERATTALPALGDALAGPVTEFWRRLSTGTSVRPDEVQVRLALSFEGGTQWAIVATAEGTIEVTLTWKRAPAG